MSRVTRNIVVVSVLLCFTVMKIGALLFRCSEEDRKLFRLLEKQEIKLINAEKRRIFNEFFY